MCVVYDELVLTHEYARERVGNTYHRGNTYPREGEQISLLVHQGNTYLRGRGWRYLFGGTENQGEHISPSHRHLNSAIMNIIMDWFKTPLFIQLS